nr:MAG TPA: hypothetical protein [Caudoviricetes sp.]
MKKIIVAALSILIGACGYTVVDKKIEERVSDLEATASSYSDEISYIKLKLDYYEDLRNNTYSPSVVTAPSGELVTRTTSSSSATTKPRRTTVKGETTTDDAEVTTEEFDTTVALQ